MPFDLNPFPVASNRHAIWEMLVRKDVGGFVAQDWKIFAPSFKFEGFCGTPRVEAGASKNSQGTETVIWINSRSRRNW
ncbi:hypothetical protein [Rhizobium laguerreae]|uniref:hypothetical protein n=1 Tax=Rhizobium laguerreae TaxID=1076926 RepID=UPI001C916FE8|nr:hypothetical protein [Rhizobium laguerreae]MBY3390251.1 hypothetical protein [Rhizobium laguerreae]MBY3403915.1 hypothetical protein [Rhizobium laguerreae]MBY3410853.1 hypothetical protein [Rhizobium laguerreae]